MEAGTGKTAADDVTNVKVKFGGRTISVSLSPESTVRDLKSLLQPLTNVLLRGQKLIFKGKVLTDEMTLKSLEVSNGSKIMLMAAEGLHQGDGPIRKEATESTTLRRPADLNPQPREKRDIAAEKSQCDRWKATGVIALSQSNLKVISHEVWTCGSSARVLDLSHNYIQELPATVGSLSSLQRLLLNANELSDDSISWEGLSSVKSLAVLSLNHNQLTSLPSALGALTCLRQLHVANNKLTCLPTEIGHLTQLQVLIANNNRINILPTSLGECASLEEVDVSSNLLLKLPETFGNLRSLKALRLSNNGLKSLPTTLFKMCIQLSTLDLHGTEVTMDLLRQFEGWEDFDKRRCLKQQKKLDFRVGGSAEFDEGADKGF